MNEHNTARDIGQCFQHFLENMPDAAKMISKLTGVHEPTLRGWWKGRPKRKPNGYTYVKVLYFLAKNGYLVKEYENLNIEVKRFLPVLVYGLMEPAAVTHLLGFQTKRPNDELLDFFRPKSHQYQVRFDRLKVFNDIHEAQFAPLVKTSDEELTQAAKDIARVAEKLKSIPIEPPLSSAELKSLYGCIMVAMPLVRRLASDGSTEGDREQFRNMFSGTDFFEFKDWVTALLGEDSRKSVIESRKRFE